MLNRFPIIAEAVSVETEISTSEHLHPLLTEALVVAVCTLGLAILVVWLFFRGGPAVLKTAPVRRNRMFPFLPLILIMLWVLMMSVFSWISKTILPDLSEAKQEILTHGIMVASELPLIGAMLLLAHQTFARGLKGFGLNPRTLGRDTGFAAVNLLAVYPLILAGIIIVQLAGKWITQDPNFDIESHQSLTLLTESSNPIIKMLIITVAAVLAPVFEELLFRGFLQTTIRSLTDSSIIAILITSVLFAILHHPHHWPALIALSCGLGYAYERSGSLFRPIIMHMLFNALSVTLTLMNAP